MHRNREIPNNEMGETLDNSGPLGEKGERMPSSPTKSKKSTTVRRHKSSDEPSVSTKADGNGDGTKREHSKSKTASQHRGRRSSNPAVDEPSVSTKTGGDGTKRLRSTSKVASQHRGRRSSMSAVDEPSVSMKPDGDGPRRERSTSKIASKHRGRRSSMSRVDEPSVSTKTDGDGPKRERSSSKIPSQHRGRRSSMSAVIDSTLDCPGFLMVPHMAGLVGGLTDLMREKKSTSSSRDSSSRKHSSDATSKRRSGSPGKHRSRSVSKYRSGSPSAPSRQRSTSHSCKQGRSSSRSKRPSGSLDKQLGSSSGKHQSSSPSKLGSQSPRSTRTAQTQSSASSRSQVTRTKSQDSPKVVARSQGQRRTSQDSIKLLVASIDMDFTDGFNMGESTVSTAVKKSEKARQARLSSVEPTDSPETDSHREKEIAYWPTRERRPSLAAGGTSRTMAIRSSVWKNPARQKGAESEAPEKPEGLDAQKPDAGSKMSGRMSNSNVAAASTVLTRTVAPSAEIKTALSNSGQQPVTRPSRRSHSVQPGGRVRRMSLRASGKSEAGKKDIRWPGAESIAPEATEVITFNPETSPRRLDSPKRSPRKSSINGDVPVTPGRLDYSTSGPVTPSKSIKSSKSGSSNKSPSSKKSQKSQSAPTGLVTKSPKRVVIKDGEDDAFGGPSQSPAPRTNKNLKSSLDKLRSSRRASLTGAVDDDAKSVVSTITRLQRRMSSPSSAKAQEPAVVIVW